MIDVAALDGELTIQDTGAPPALCAEVAARVDALWEAEQARRGAALYDAQLFSLTAREGARLRGAFVPYRRFVAQRADPRLDAALRVRPLGVMGLCLVEDGVLFGLRSDAMLVDPGCWELPPSGGVDPGARETGGRIAAERQLFAELGEELHVRPAEVRRVAPLALVRDTRSSITEVAFELELTLSFAEVRARHAAGDNHEYAELCHVPPGEVAAFGAARGARLTGAARALLAHQGLL